jgi:hypothetical protein
MNHTRIIHLNPQSKGNLGKSFETEFRTAWLDYLRIPWTGSDLDDRHHTFLGRHTRNVRSYHLGNGHESKSTLLTLFRKVLKQAEPVHVIDTRAQADGLILAALEELQILEICEDAGVRLVFFLFPTDDTESMRNLANLFCYAGDRVDYVIVENPIKTRGDLFKGSGVEAKLTEFNARRITLPGITATTLLAVEKAEATAGRGISFAELAHPGSGHLERILAGEIQWAIASLFHQYTQIANHLLPPALASTASYPSPAAAQPLDQPDLNFGD